MKSQTAATPDDLVVEPRRRRNPRGGNTSTRPVSGTALRRRYFIASALQGLALGLFGPVVTLALVGESRPVVWIGVAAGGVLAAVTAFLIAAALSDSYRTRRRRELVNAKKGL